MPGLSCHRRPHRGGGAGALRISAIAHPSDRGARNPLDGARQRRPHAVSARRAVAGEPADVECQPEHVPIRDRHGAQGEPDHAAGRAAGRRRARQERGARLAAADRRSHGRMVPQGRLRRLQPDAAVPAGRARRFRRAGAAGAAAARPVPHRIRRPHVARASRAWRGRRAAMRRRLRRASKPSRCRPRRDRFIARRRSCPIVDTVDPLAGVSRGRGDRGRGRRRRARTSSCASACRSLPPSPSCRCRSASRPAFSKNTASTSSAQTSAAQRGRIRRWRPRVSTSSSPAGPTSRWWRKASTRSRSA